MSNAPTAERYRQHGLWPRWRLRLTILGLFVLLFLSWHWGSSTMAQWSYPAGALVTATGVLLRVWAAGWLHKSQVLTTGGPYAHTRNPLYLGTAVLALGHGLMSAVGLASLVVPVLCLIIYRTAMRDEEAYLAHRYGDSFEKYRAQVPLWMPRTRPYLATATGRFSWQQVKRNREYEAAVVNALMIAVYGWLHQAR